MVVEEYKVISAEYMAGILKVEFNNQKIKYLKSKYNKDLVDAYSLKKSKNKSAGLLFSQFNSWVGTKVNVDPKGNVLINNDENYTSAYLWENGVDSIDEL